MLFGKLLLVALLFSLTLMAVLRTRVAANLHTAAAACLHDSAVTEMGRSCWQSCTPCHPPTDPVEPLDIYLDGDAELCLACHPENGHRAPGTFLLRLVKGGGNHPVGIAYDPYSSATGLRFDPDGPRLFVDANGRNPRMHCSTCHDPMGDAPKLLRISNSRSALCLACHDK